MSTPLFAFTVVSFVFYLPHRKKSAYKFDMENSFNEGENEREREREREREKKRKREGHSVKSTLSTRVMSSSVKRKEEKKCHIKHGYSLLKQVFKLNIH